MKNFYVRIITKEADAMNTVPLIIAVIAGILYGSVRSVKNQNSKDESAKKEAGLYLQSIVVCIAVYLIVSFVQSI